MSLPDRANLGCGDDYRDGWWNVDHNPEYEADAHFDLEDIPWTDADGKRVPDDAFTRVVMDNVLEHLSNQLEVLEELARVTKPGGQVVLSGPHWNSKGAWVDPTHTRPFDPDTLQHYTVSDYYDVEWVETDRVRFGRLLPQDVALWLADHVGHIVSGFTVTARRTEVPV